MSELLGKLFSDELVALKDMVAIKKIQGRKENQR